MVPSKQNHPISSYKLLDLKLSINKNVKDLTCVQWNRAINVSVMTLLQ